MGRLIIFDLDGTLVDSRNSILNSIRHSLSSLQLAHWKFDEEAAVRQDLRTTFMAAAQIHESSPAESLIEKFVKNYREHHSSDPKTSMQPYPEVAELLESLHRDFELAIATTKHSAQAKHVLDQLEMSQYFDVIQGTDPGMRYKPSPDILHAVMQTLGREPNECMYVGDSSHDMEAAHAAKMLAIGAAYGFGGRPHLEPARPHQILEKPKDLLKVLEIESIQARPFHAIWRHRPNARKTRSAWTAAQLAIHSPRRGL